jgi:hypothetical protein
MNLIYNLLNINVKTKNNIVEQTNFIITDLEAEVK